MEWIVRSQRRPALEEGLSQRKPTTPGPKSSESVLGTPLRKGTGETVDVYVAEVNAGLKVCM